MNHSIVLAAFGLFLASTSPQAFADDAPSLATIQNAGNGARLEITPSEFGYQIVSHAPEKIPTSYFITNEYFVRFAHRPYQGYENQKLFGFVNWGWWGLTENVAGAGPIALPVIAILSLPLAIADLPVIPFRLIHNRNLQKLSGKNFIRQVFEGGKTVEISDEQYQAVQEAVRVASFKSITTNYIMGYDTWRSRESKRLERKHRRLFVEDPYFPHRPSLECDFSQDGVFVVRASAPFGPRTRKDLSDDPDPKAHIRNFRSDASIIGRSVFIADENHFKRMIRHDEIRTGGAYDPDKNRYLLPIIYSPNQDRAAPESTGEATLYGILAIDLSTMQGSLSFHQRDIQGLTTMDCRLKPGNW